MISSLLLNFVIFYLLAVFLNKFPKAKSVFSKLPLAVLGAAGIWLLVTSLGYLLTPLFFDHAEAAVASVGANWLFGGSLYTPIDDIHRYSILYGPLPYLASALAQSLFPWDAIVAAKLVGVLNLALVFVAAAGLLKRARVDFFSGLWVLGVLAITLLSFYNMAYWNRPDSFLIAYTFLAFWAVRADAGRGAWWTYLFIAFLTGLSVNCKVHGFLYFLPIVALFFESNFKSFSLPKVIVAVAFSVFVALLPFTFSGVSLPQYLEWLSMATKHGLLLKEFVKNGTYIGSFLLLLWLLRFNRRLPWTFAVSMGVGVLISLIASKPGSGAPHFLPLMPIFMWWALEQYQAAGGEEKKKFATVLGAFILMLGLNAVNRQKRVNVLFKETSLRLREYQDLQNMISKLTRPAELGYTDASAYESSFYKTALVIKGWGLLLETSALMDMKASSIEIPAGTKEALRSCQTPYFILPKNGEPWSLASFYNQVPVFDAEFVSAFHSQYTLIEQSEFYRLYECQSEKTL